MRICRVVTLIVLIVACATAWSAEVPAGRHGVLLDLHGYNHAGAVVVPLAPLVHWLDATVADVDGWTAVMRGDDFVYLQLPRSRPDGLGALVRLRDVAEGLGVDVRYRAWDGDEGAMLGHIPHVELTDGDRMARVIVHAAPPQFVSALLADVDRGDRCVAWLLRVSAVAGDWAKTHEPQWHEEFGFGEQYVTGVLRRVEGRWQYALRSGKVSHTPEELADAGIPIEIARALGMEIEE
ncbi:MAG: hypothetical protein ACOX9R_00505 [Armatimonadota bacterium]|jgi:hypothetical protein